MLRVVRGLESSGVSSVWLPLGGDDVEYDLKLTPHSSSLAVDGVALDDDTLLDSEVILFRRWRQRLVTPVVSTLRESEHRAFAEREWSAAIDLLLLRIERERPELRWAERPSTISVTRSRLALLDHAAASGLKVPPWQVVTNLSSAAIGEHELVAKSVDRDEAIGADRLFSTAVVAPGALASAIGAPPTPTHLQRRVERICEYRAFYAFGTILTVAQRTTAFEVDIRHVEPEDLDLREEDLPPACATAIGRLCDHLGLGMCAFDLIRDEDRIWLVDVTPNGSWDHLETDADPWLSNRISAAIIEATG